MIARIARAALAFALLPLLGGLLAAAQPAPITAEAALSAPLASATAAAPAGRRLAWVVDERGVRNLWLAEPDASGQMTARALTHCNRDDGFEIGDLAWSPDGQTIAYVRGGSIEGGAPPNFEAMPEGMPLRQIWTIGIAGGAPRKIADGYAPAFAPQGDRIAFLSGGVVVAAADGSNAMRISDRGDAGGLNWSPDGRRLAFVSDRGDRDFIGVLDIAENRITWMAPGFGEDRLVTWSRDGARLAFVRIAVRRMKSNAPRLTGDPWSIWVADAATGVGREVFRADPGLGSVFNGLDGGPRSLIWAANDRLVFPWEKTGWQNLYAVPAAGGAAQALAGGSFEIFSAVASLDGSAIIYAANRGDLNTRHLRRVALATGVDSALTSGEAFADRPFQLSDGTIGMMRGTARLPFWPTLLHDGAPVPLGGPASTAPAALPVPRIVNFQSSDGLHLSGQLFEPPGPAPKGGRPAILYFHGGPARQMLTGYNPSIFYARSYAMNRWLAAQGYVVLSVNYRGGIGYGAEFREAKGFGITGASEVADIRGAATFLVALPGIDRSRIGIYGASYGGHMTALGLARVPEMFAAGVDYAGVHDWRAYAAQLSRPEAPVGAADLAWRSSALSDVSRWGAPVLVAAADDDRNVAFSQSVALVEALRSRGVAVDELVIPNEVHDLRMHRSWLAWIAATDDFLARHLRPGSDRQAAK